MKTPVIRFRQSHWLRLSSLLSLIWLSALVLGACGDLVTPTSVATVSVADPTPTPQPGIGDPAHPVTLTWSFWGDEAEIDINKRLAKQFETENPGIKINMIYDSWTNYFTDLKTIWTGDKAPDVMFMDNIPTMANDGKILSIEPLIKRDQFDTTDFYAGLLDMFRYDGSLYGLPRDNDTKVIYVNLDMLKEAGIAIPQGGWTWQDLLADATKLTKRDANGQVSQYGFAFEPDYWWKLWVWQNGAEVYDNYQPPLPPTHLLLNNKAASDGVQFFADLINKAKVTPSYEDMNSSDKIASLFATNKLAMAFGNHADIPVFGKTAGLHWDVVPLPAGQQRVNVLGGAGYVINKTTQHPDEAWTFVKWLTGPVGQALLADTGLVVPARKSVREDNIFLRQQTYNTQVFLQETELGHKYPEFLMSDDIDSLMDTDIEPVWKGQATAAEVFAKLPSKVEPIFERARKGS